MYCEQPEQSPGPDPCAGLSYSQTVTGHSHGAGPGAQGWSVETEHAVGKLHEPLSQGTCCPPAPIFRDDCFSYCLLLTSEEGCLELRSCLQLLQPQEDMQELAGMMWWPLYPVTPAAADPISLVCPAAEWERWQKLSHRMCGNCLTGTERGCSRQELLLLSLWSFAKFMSFLETSLYGYCLWDSRLISRYVYL